MPFRQNHRSRDGWLRARNERDRDRSIGTNDGAFDDVADDDDDDVTLQWPSSAYQFAVDDSLAIRLQVLEVPRASCSSSRDSVPREEWSEKVSVPRSPWREFWNVLPTKTLDNPMSNRIECALEVTKAPTIAVLALVGPAIRAPGPCVLPFGLAQVDRLNPPSSRSMTIDGNTLASPRCGSGRAA